MSEISTEQIVKVRAPKWSYLFRGVMIVACVLAATTIPQTKALIRNMNIRLLMMHFQLTELWLRIRENTVGHMTCQELCW